MKLEAKPWSIHRAMRSSQASGGNSPSSDAPEPHVAARPSATAMTLRLCCSLPKEALPALIALLSGPVLSLICSRWEGLMPSTWANWCGQLGLSPASSSPREAPSQGRFEDAGARAQPGRRRASPLSVRPSIPDNAVPSLPSTGQPGVTSPPFSLRPFPWDNGPSCLSLPPRGFQIPSSSGQRPICTPRPRVGAMQRWRQLMRELI